MSSSTSPYENGLRRRPLRDVAGGPAQQARWTARCRSYLTASRLLMDGDGRAEIRLTFPQGARSRARADGARTLASAYGVQVRALAPSRGQALTLTVSGAAEDVARYAAALPRVLDYVEVNATQAAHAFGRWTRHSRASEHMARLGAVELRALARAFRAAAFRVIVDVLAGPQDAPVPACSDTLTPMEQVEAIAGGLAQYGWVDIREAYDPAEADQFLADADQAAVRGHAALADGLGAHAGHAAAPAAGEQLVLPLVWSAPTRSACGPVVVIPCSARKRGHSTTAGRMYLGSLHTLARTTADALTASGGVVVVLSALHGLLPLDRVIAPYDHQWKDAGSVTISELREQAAALGLADADDVVLLTPGEYTRRAAAVWSHARAPLAHLGIGRQRGRLAALRADPSAYTTAA